MTNSQLYSDDESSKTDRLSWKIHSFVTKKWNDIVFMVESNSSIKKNNKTKKKRKKRKKKKWN
jgi:hypothetical protein